MKSETFDLTERNIQEDYEDLIFRKVMAIRCEEESKEILEEMQREKAEKTADTKEVEQIFDRRERKENIEAFSGIAKKVFLFAASFVFVVIISVSSAVVASAEVREAVTDAIYHLIFEENEKYTLVSVGESTGFVDPELYDWEGAYAPTYMPEGYEFVEKENASNIHIIKYSNNSEKIIIKQFISFNFLIDSENSDHVENVFINDSQGLLIEKDNYFSVSWVVGETMLVLEGNIGSEEMLKIAESIKIIK
ncbi:MAG: DUF4367 domain-containing protein [Oscillospiraceae bacterium]|nr:DUF4367 domain-containing protein [Oscillospiraceae bacterium]